MLARHVPLFAEHAVASHEDHPDGHGARNFYTLANLDPVTARQTLLQYVRKGFPRDAQANGVPVCDIRIQSVADVNAEVIQYMSCAAWRTCLHLATGGIPAHLQR